MTQTAFWTEQPAATPAPDKPKPVRAKKIREADTYIPVLADYPASERPVRRLLELGPMSLSSTELLAILIGSPTQITDAGTLITTFGDLPAVAKASPGELLNVPHVGETIVARLKAAFELGRRLMNDSGPDRTQVRSPADAANLVMSEMMTLEQEHLKIVLLDTKNRVIHITTLYIGSLNTSLIRIGEVFRDAIRANAAAIIVTHNHPSGDPTPSPEDVAVTRQIVEAGKLIDIDVLDHLIIGANRWTSMKERGLGFP
jgi:DNA repair protein RadC